MRTETTIPKDASSHSISMRTETTLPKDATEDYEGNSKRHYPCPTPTLINSEVCRPNHLSEGTHSFIQRGPQIQPSPPINWGMEKNHRTLPPTRNGTTSIWPHESLSLPLIK